MWYVLHARPGTRLVFGLKPEVTAETFRQAIETVTLETQLHYLPIQAGDTIFVEAGSVHALLEGTMVVEVQQNSDITYRVYDWGRLGADGKPRPLHIDKAIEVINFDQIEPGPYQPRLVARENGLTRAEISRCDYFVVEKVELKAGTGYQGHTDGRTLEIWGAVEGQSTLTCPTADPVDLSTICFCLVPAVLGDFTITAQTDCRMLRVYLP
jgi:mannose-6-phosphate isomerase